MNRAAFLIALLALPLIAVAKGETTRIEIARDESTLLTLTAEAARDFTIWSGPGTGVRLSDGSLRMSITRLDYADWAAGSVVPPAKLLVYDVRFYCAARTGARGEVVRDTLCYGVRYAIDPQTGTGYFQIPPSDDPQFPISAQKIARGVEGSWYRASARWESRVRPKIDSARLNMRAGAPAIGHP